MVLTNQKTIKRRIGDIIMVADSKGYEGRYDALKRKSTEMKPEQLALYDEINRKTVFYLEDFKAILTAIKADTKLLQSGKFVADGSDLDTRAQALARVARYQQQLQNLAYRCAATLDFDSDKVTSDLLDSDNALLKQAAKVLTAFRELDSATQTFQQEHADGIWQNFQWQLFKDLHAEGRLQQFTESYATYGRQAQQLAAMQKVLALHRADSDFAAPDPEYHQALTNILLVAVNAAQQQFAATEKQIAANHATVLAIVSNYSQADVDALLSDGVTFDIGNFQAAIDGAIDVAEPLFESGLLSPQQQAPTTTAAFAEFATHEWRSKFVADAVAQLQVTLGDNTNAAATKLNMTDLVVNVENIPAAVEKMQFTKQYGTLRSQWLNIKSRFEAKTGSATDLAALLENIPDGYAADMQARLAEFLVATAAYREVLAEQASAHPETAAKYQAMLAELEGNAEEMQTGFSAKLDVARKATLQALQERYFANPTISQYRTSQTRLALQLDNVERLQLIVKCAFATLQNEPLNEADRAAMQEFEIDEVADVMPLVSASLTLQETLSVLMEEQESLKIQQMQVEKAHIAVVELMLNTNIAAVDEQETDSPLVIATKNGLRNMQSMRDGMLAKVAKVEALDAVTREITADKTHFNHGYLKNVLHTVLALIGANRIAEAVDRFDSVMHMPWAIELLKQEADSYELFQEINHSLATHTAAAIMHHDHALFAAVTEQELVSVSKYGDRSVVPALFAIEDWSNHLSSFIVSDLLRGDIAQRTIFLERWIAVAQDCFDNGDLQGALVIYAAVQDTAVTRLKATHSGLSETALASLETLNVLVNADNNMAGYRALVDDNSAKQALVPVVQYVKKDLIMADEGNTLDTVGKHTTARVAQQQQFLTGENAYAPTEFTDFVRVVDAQVLDNNTNRTEYFLQKSRGHESRDAEVKASSLFQFKARSGKKLKRELGSRLGALHRQKATPTERATQKTSAVEGLQAIEAVLEENLGPLRAVGIDMMRLGGEIHQRGASKKAVSEQLDMTMILDVDTRLGSLASNIAVLEATRIELNQLSDRVDTIVAGNKSSSSIKQAAKPITHRISELQKQMTSQLASAYKWQTMYLQKQTETKAWLQKIDLQWQDLLTGDYSEKNAAQVDAELAHIHRQVSSVLYHFDQAGYQQALDKVDAQLAQLPTINAIPRDAENRNMLDHVMLLKTYRSNLQYSMDLLGQAQALQQQVARCQQNPAMYLTTQQASAPTVDGGIQRAGVSSFDPEEAVDVLQEEGVYDTTADANLRTSQRIDNVGEAIAAVSNTLEREKTKTDASRKSFLRHLPSIKNASAIQRALPSFLKSVNEQSARLDSHAAQLERYQVALDSGAEFVERVGKQESATSKHQQPLAGLKTKLLGAGKSLLALRREHNFHVSGLKAVANSVMFQFNAWSDMATDRLKNKATNKRVSHLVDSTSKNTADRRTAEFKTAFTAEFSAVSPKLTAEIKQLNRKQKELARLLKKYDVEDPVAELDKDALAGKSFMIKRLIRNAMDRYEEIAGQLEKLEMQQGILTATNIELSQTSQPADVSWKPDDVAAGGPPAPPSMEDLAVHSMHAPSEELTAERAAKEDAALEQHAAKAPGQLAEEDSAQLSTVPAVSLIIPNITAQHLQTAMSFSRDGIGLANADADTVAADLAVIKLMQGEAVKIGPHQMKVDFEQGALQFFQGAELSHLACAAIMDRVIIFAQRLKTALNADPKAGKPEMAIQGLYLDNEALDSDGLELGLVRNINAMLGKLDFTTEMAFGHYDDNVADAPTWPSAPAIKAN